MKIAAFSKYLGYHVGGAERSLIQTLKAAEQAENAEITILYCNELRTFSASQYHIDFPAMWKIIPLKIRFCMNAFFYTEYFLNQDVIKSFFRDFKADVLYAQGLWAPAAINAFSGPSVRFIRDENDLNIWGNYHTGFKKFAKMGYQLAELPAFQFYCHENRKSIKKTDRVIVNSKFMTDQLDKRFGKESEIQYPPINFEDLKYRFEQVSDEVSENEKAIIMVGDTVIKGIGLFHKIARRFLSQKFMVFGRSYSEPRQISNVTYMPWQNDIADVYKWARLVLVPSVWNEAYGRVAAEAKGLGIPVIVSNKGGLPEAVDYDPQCIAEDYDDMTVKIARWLNHNDHAKNVINCSDQICV